MSTSLLRTARYLTLCFAQFTCDLMPHYSSLTVVTILQAVMRKAKSHVSIPELPPNYQTPSTPSVTGPSFSTRSWDRLKHIPDPKETDPSLKTERTLYKLRHHSATRVTELGFILLRNLYANYKESPALASATSVSLCTSNNP